MAQAAAFTTPGHQPVLIEDWLPIRELGIESVRERQVASALPPMSFLHVWWARVPLAAAAGVTLTALLPPWHDSLLQDIEGLREALGRTRSGRVDLRDRAKELNNADWYRIWVLLVAGIRGDAAGKMDDALARGEKPDFTWRQAYKNKPSVADLNVLHRLLVHRWGHVPRVLDPTAGGGSIPFVSLRYGLPTHANDLNPVAYGILDATLRASARYGLDLLPDIEKWGDELSARVRRRLDPFFGGEDPDEHITAYIFANSIHCPRTGGPVPLSPNWWLDQSDGGTAVRPIAVHDNKGKPLRMDFELIYDVEGSGYGPDEGTVKGGDAVSPWDDLVIDGDYIKAEAQAGRMDPVLFAIAAWKPKTSGRGKHRYFRLPAQTDLDALMQAQAELERLLPDWERDDILPRETVPLGNDKRPHHYGMSHWRDMFTARQQLTHGVFVEEWRRLLPEVREALGNERGDEVMNLLAMRQSSGLNWNSRMSSWNVGRQGLRSTFDRHDFSFKWTFAEFDGGALAEWSQYQIWDAYKKLAELIEPDTDVGKLDRDELEHAVPAEATLSVRSASDLPILASGSVDLVNMDPPYYDNVMYAELADFFYVWEKRTLGLIHPGRFDDELTDKENEAVANPARFEGAGRRRKELAAFDYQQKMQAIFTECHRVLQPDGVMVVWFTHKKAEAWDTLGTAVMDAGFAIEASWPVNTQPLISLHHAKKNSVKSTVMLVCRKRGASSGGVFFEDLEADVRRAARQAAEKFEQQVGAGGVDLLLSTYGPTLSVISGNWPVLSSEADESGRARRLKPEEALTVAREEVTRIVKTRLVGHDATFDAATDFWLMCWATFEAREFPYDEARKLGMSTGYGVDEAIDAGLLKQTSGNVVLQEPTKRARTLRRRADDQGRFVTLVDAVQHMLNVHDTDGLATARAWLSDSGYSEEQAFLDVVQAAVNAVPRVRGKKGLTLPEARLLEDAVVALFGDEIRLLVEIQEQASLVQGQLDI